MDGQGSTDMTSRQRQALDAVAAHFAAAGRPPSYKELAARLGIGINAASDLVKALDRCGRLRIVRRRGYLTQIRMILPAAELTTAELEAELATRRPPQAVNDPGDKRRARAA